MNRIRKVFVSAFAGLIPLMLYAYVEGPPAGSTGAPGENPLACATCHTNSASGGPINAAGGKVVATFSSGSSYTPGGSPITITVSVSDPQNSLFGFQMTARLESNPISGAAGDFTAGANQIVVCGNNRPKGSGNCNGGVEFISHSFPGGLPQSTPYTFTWTPPATDVGKVHFFVAGNAVNGNRQADRGDHVYTAEFVLTPASANSAPAIVTGGVLNAASFAKDANGHGTPVAPGSLVAIFASNIGSDESDAAAVPLPKALGDLTVTIGGTAAPILNVIPAAGIINAQVPFEVSAGANADVVVKFNQTASQPQPISIVATAPGIFTIPPGIGNAVFVNLSDGTIAAAESASSALGVKTRPVTRGEQGLFYATGLGALTPFLADGANDTNQLHDANQKPLVWIGGVSAGVTAQVLFAGQAPQFPGVNQINIIIPENAPVGDSIPIQIQSTDGTVTSQVTATIAIR